MVTKGWHPHGTVAWQWEQSLLMEGERVCVCAGSEMRLKPSKPIYSRVLLLGKLRLLKVP